jgi:hypothetical protein
MAQLIAWGVALAALIGIAWGVNKMLDTHYAGPVRTEMARQKQAYTDVIAVNERTIKAQSDSLTKVAADAQACSDGTKSLEAEAQLHSDAAQIAMAEARRSTEAVRIAADSLRKIAAGPPITDACAAARKFGEEYAREVKR